MTDRFKELAAPFPPERVSWRVGSTNNDKTRGLALAYIDARDVMERLDAVLGPDNWQDEIHGDGPRTICRIGIRVAPGVNEWIWKTDGAGDTAVEFEKGAISDAFKRAAVKWGIGRYLYDVEATWVEIETFGRSSKIKDGEYRKLAEILAGKSQPSQSAKQDQDARDAVAATIRLGISMAEDLKALQQFWTNNSKHVAAMPDDVRMDLTFLKDRRKAELSQKAAA